MAKKNPPLSLPCLRSSFGNWIYYTCNIPLSEAVKRVKFAEEVHKSKALSDLIQRRLSGPRAARISDYLTTNDERFFNSLVLATYGGDPQWYEIGNLTSTAHAAVLQSAPDGIFDGLGILRFEGAERIFALDGQHRLAGMKKALAKKPALGTDLVPVLLVGHKNTAVGTRRTRRLFTTLNKTAVAVKKMDIIALDEDDVMAITARDLVESNAGFKDPKTAIISSEAMPPTNMTALLTISGLYDILKLILWPAARARNPKITRVDMRFNRPDDADLKYYSEQAVAYFNALGKTFAPVGEFLAATDSGPVVKKYRTTAGGHVLFRTIGMDVFTRTAVAIARRDGITVVAALAEVAKLPTRLDREPYRGVIWDPVGRKIKPTNKPLMSRVLFYMLGVPLTDRQRSNLLSDYRAAMGVEKGDTSVKLPARVV